METNKNEIVQTKMYQIELDICVDPIMKHYNVQNVTIQQCVEWFKNVHNLGAFCTEPSGNAGGCPVMILSSNVKENIITFLKLYCHGETSDVEYCTNDIVLV